jgi:hypothetical protein
LLGCKKPKGKLKPGRQIKMKVKTDTEGKSKMVAKKSQNRCERKVKIVARWVMAKICEVSQKRRSALQGKKGYMKHPRI